WMFRVLLNACYESKYFIGIEFRPWHDFCELWLPDRQGSRLVKYGDRASIDRFEDSGILDDDAAPGGERDGAENGNRNRNKQRARRRDDKDGEKSRRLSARDLG